ncbi:MAG: hypothetical protein WC719_01750 [Patescibacteria group bacterium]|jgi:hypothetical protein
MRKIMLFSGLVLLISYSQAAGIHDQPGLVVKYGNQFLVLEKGRPTSAKDKSFIFHQESFSAIHFYEINNRDFDEVYIVKDTIKIIDPLVEGTITSFGSTLSIDAYEIWKSGQKKIYRRSYNQGYNAWLTQNIIRSVETSLYYSGHEIWAYQTEKSQSRFPWENIALFLALFIVGIKTRNVFRNCGRVSLALVATLYLIVAIAFLGPWTILAKSRDSFIMVLVATFSLIVMLANDYNSIFLFLSKRKNKKRTRLGFIVVIGMNLLIGTIFFLSLGYYQFIWLSLGAGLAAYFFPFCRGKRDSKREFIIPTSEKLEA